nr:immunoglobulin heavy chain junction region [Macaca mulatta]MPN83866.1 immunoglobulin heavy chain junction region [Macaca mulatta]MPN83934.1 immunoglobulin heavy chain junction region [Macaca mulatta]MPN83952.1 immunoglobulin heavy chain junction region [Macaca mulatta]MPN83983.1 immunoglobulin heavy chain junction region [Macaca mulatta]
CARDPYSGSWKLAPPFDYW